jgi:hypothetical protein
MARAEPDVAALDGKAAPAQGPAADPPGLADSSAGAAEPRGTGLWQLRDFDPALQMAVFWYVQSVCDQLQRLSPGQARELAEAAGDACCSYPCWLRDEAGNFPEFELPHIGRRSSVYVIAVMVAYIVWVQCHLADNPLPDSPLLVIGRDALNTWRLLRGVSPARPARPESPDGPPPGGVQLELGLVGSVVPAVAALAAAALTQEVG